MATQKPNYENMGIEELIARKESLEKWGYSVPEELLEMIPSQVGTITIRVNANSPVFEGNRILGTVISIDSEVTTSKGNLTKEVVKEHNPFKDYHTTVVFKEFPSFAKRKKESLNGRNFLGRMEASYNVTYDLMENPVLANRMSANSGSKLQIMASVGRERKVVAATAAAAEIPEFSSLEEQIAFFKSRGNEARTENANGLRAWQESRAASMQEAAEEGSFAIDELTI